MTDPTLHFLNALAALDEILEKDSDGCPTCSEYYSYDLDYFAECSMDNMTAADRAEFKRAVKIWATI